MDIVISVDNIKCGGCAASIKYGLHKIIGILSVEVDIKGESVLITADHNVRAQATKALQDMGYPEKGSMDGFQALGAKAKSFVSCAIGRVDHSK